MVDRMGFMVQEGPPDKVQRWADSSQQAAARSQKNVAAVIEMQGEAPALVWRELAQHKVLGKQSVVAGLGAALGRWRR